MTPLSCFLTKDSIEMLLGRLAWPQSKPDLGVCNLSNLGRES